MISITRKCLIEKQNKKDVWFQTIENNFGNPEKGKIKIRSHNENIEDEVNI